MYTDKYQENILHKKKTRAECELNAQIATTALRPVSFYLDRAVKSSFASFSSYCGGGSLASLATGRDDSKCVRFAIICGSAGSLDLDGDDWCRAVFAGDARRSWLVNKSSRLDCNTAVWEVPELDGGGIWEGVFVT